MATKQITIERFSVISAKPFAEVVRAIEAQVGHPDIKQFYEAIQAAEDDQELQRVVNLAIGPNRISGLEHFGYSFPPSSDNLIQSGALWRNLRLFEEVDRNQPVTSRY